MGKTIALANQKGGVGKTTTTVNLGAALAALDKKVLIIDADPQANATSGLGVDPETIEGDSLLECLVDNASMSGAVIHTKSENLDIVPSNIDLVAAEVTLLQSKNKEFFLRNSITPELKSQYDYILIDCSPSLGVVTLNALTAADSVLIPVQAEYFALEGIAKLLQTIKLVQAHLNSGLKIEGFVITMYDRRARLSRQVVEEINNTFGKLTFQTLIDRNVKLAEAPSFGQNVIDYDATCSGAKNYMQLAQELLSREV